MKEKCQARDIIIQYINYLLNSVQVKYVDLDIISLGKDNIVENISH